MLVRVADGFALSCYYCEKEDTGPLFQKSPRATSFSLLPSDCVPLWGERGW